jgi:adenosine deaminase
VRSTVALPKAHLHLHFDGSLPLPAVVALSGGSFERPATFADTDAFFRDYLTVPAMVRTLDDLRALAASLVESEAAAGSVYIEPGVEPWFYAPRLGSMDDVFRAMWDGFSAGSAATGVEVGCMVGVNTDMSVALAEEVAAAAARWAGSGAVAFGTAGFVEPAGLARFRGAVKTARAAGLRIVCHAGQTGGPDSVVEALDELRPDRIAHGVNSVRDPALLRRLADEQVVCDVALTSNVRLGVAPTFEEHPLPRLLDAGVPVTLNADDELWFGSSVADEYELARRTFGFSDEQLAGMAMAGTIGTGASAATVERLKAGIEAWLRS